MLCLTFHDSCQSISSIIWNLSILYWPGPQRGTHAERRPEGIGEHDCSYQALLVLQAGSSCDNVQLATAFTVVKILLSASSAALATKQKQCLSLDGRLRALQWEHNKSQVRPPVTLACLFCQQALTSCQALRPELAGPEVADHFMPAVCVMSSLFLGGVKLICSQQHTAMLLL